MEPQPEAAPGQYRACRKGQARFDLVLTATVAKQNTEHLEPTFAVSPPHKWSPFENPEFTGNDNFLKISRTNHNKKKVFPSLVPQATASLTLLMVENCTLRWVYTWHGSQEAGA